jgi:hypothetical protein
MILILVVVLPQTVMAEVGYGTVEITSSKGMSSVTINWTDSSKPYWVGTVSATTPYRMYVTTGERVTVTFRSTYSGYENPEKISMIVQDGITNTIHGEYVENVPPPAPTPPPVDGKLRINSNLSQATYIVKACGDSLPGTVEKCYRVGKFSGESTELNLPDGRYTVQFPMVPGYGYQKMRMASIAQNTTATINVTFKER